MFENEGFFNVFLDFVIEIVILLGWFFCNDFIVNVKEVLDSVDCDVKESNFFKVFVYC